ncbi:MAG: TraR/DksA family transcriptional regulator [Opitutales bacterium]
MEKSLQASFRPKIEARIAELDEQMESSKGDREAIAPDKAIGRLSRLDAMQMQQMALGMNTRMREEVKQLKEALQRIDRGRYGTCELCRQDIPMERLEFQLDATICVSCFRRARK